MQQVKFAQRSSNETILWFDAGPCALNRFRTFFRQPITKNPYSCSNPVTLVFQQILQRNALSVLACLPHIHIRVSVIMSRKMSQTNPAGT
jgi:hypothetical protein